MDKKYKALQVYLQKFTDGYRLTYHLSNSVIEGLTKKFTLSRAEVMEGVIQFSHKTGIKIDFDRDASNNLEE